MTIKKCETQALTKNSIDKFILGCGNFGGIGSGPELMGFGENKEQSFLLLDKGSSRFAVDGAEGESNEN
jgi:hypothetical protein